MLDTDTAFKGIAIIFSQRATNIFEVFCMFFAYGTTFDI